MEQRFTAYACSLPLSAEDMLDLYELGTGSETPVGSDAEETGQLVNFTAALIRQDARNLYSLEDPLSETQRDLLNALSVAPSQVEALTGDVNGRYLGVPAESAIRTLPVLQKKKQERPPKPQAENPQPKRPRGRPGKQ